MGIILTRYQSGKIKIGLEKYGSLPKDFKHEWITALRSGIYKQGHGKLKDADGRYCCLGVACAIKNCDNILNKKFIYKDGEIGKDNMISHDKKALIKENTIPITSVENIPSTIRGMYSEIANVLAELNDDGSSFKEIAEVIETYL
jgi:hypothetical protein